MKINLRRLEEERDGRGSLTAEERITVTDTFDTQRTVDCRIELSWERRGGVIIFHGDLAGELTTKCDLCLEEVPTLVNGNFDVVVRKGGVRGSYDDEAGDETQDLVTLSPSQYEFSFDQYIIENLIMNLPMQIVCKEDCKGLCPQCGINRNQSSCDCTETADPRLDTLRKLKND
jgi:uncharacterized protein